MDNTTFDRACIEMFNRQHIDHVAPARGTRNRHRIWLSAACTRFYQLVRDREPTGLIKLADTFTDLWDVVNPFFMPTRYAIRRCGKCYMPKSVMNVVAQVRVDELCNCYRFPALRGVPTASV